MDNSKRVVAIGFFDGIHVGHAALLNKTKDRAAEIGAIPSVLTFDVHPDNLVFGKEVPLLNSAKGRESIIRREFGIENVVFIHFNQKVMHMDWKEFVDEIINELDVAWIVVGHDFCFGYKGMGNAARLKEYSESLGIGCDIIPAVCRDGIVVSSTNIRKLIEAGEIEKANEYLGHAHTLEDTVRSGYHLGAKMGAPTINMKLPEGVLVPRFGVYATKVFLDDGTEHVAVTNVGVRPTVSDENRVSVESFIIDFSGNLYDRHVRLELHSFLRPEKKFASQEELAAQIKLDTENARKFFNEKSSE